MKEIDDLPLHRKNKLLVYYRYVLSKVSWHFTGTELLKTWATDNLDNLVSKYTRGTKVLQHPNHNGVKIFWSFGNMKISSQLIYIPKIKLC